LAPFLRSRSIPRLLPRNAPPPCKRQRSSSLSDDSQPERPNRQEIQAPQEDLESSLEDGFDNSGLDDPDLWEWESDDENLPQVH